MFGPLKDIPEPILGGAVAASLWVAVCYAALTPRILDAEVENNIMPACMAQLKAAQETALNRAVKQAEEERAYEVEKAERDIRVIENTLREIIQKKGGLEKLEQEMCKTGICGMFRAHIDALPSNEKLQDMDATITRKKEQLAQLLSPISFPRTPDGEIAKTCTCAAMQSLSGKRMDYAISLASFRLIEPKSISQTKSDLRDALRFDACGKPSWESL